MPVTALGVAIASVAIAAVGTGVATYSAIAQGQAASAAAKYNAAVARNNALAAEQQSTIDADRIRKRNRLLFGHQEAAAAKSGMDLSGSIDDVIYDSSVQGEMDRLAALYTGKVSANAQEARATLSDYEARNAKTASYWGAGGTLLSGSGQVAGAYGNYLKIRDGGPGF